MIRLFRLFCLMPEGNSFNGHLKWMFPYSGPLKNVLAVERISVEIHRIGDMCSCRLFH